MRIRNIAIFAAVVIIAITIWTGLARTPVTPQAGPEAPAARVELDAIDIATVEAGDIDHALPLTGTLTALQQTTLTAQVEARIAAVSVRPGDKVSAGQVLLRFDTADLERQRAVAAAQLAKSREQLAYQQKLAQRNADLLAQNFISRNAFDNLQSELQTAAADERATLAQLGLADQALANATVKAPFAGIIASREVEPGQRVSINSRLLTLVDLGELELAAGVPSTQIAAVRPGQTVSFRVQGYERPYVGTIRRISPTVDETTKTVAVYVRVPNEDGALRSGLFAEGHLLLETRRAVPSLPGLAIHADGEQHYVLSLENGLLVRRNVTLGARDAQRDRVEIASGLKPGQQVLAGNLGLPAGTAVSVHGQP